MRKRTISNRKDWLKFWMIISSFLAVALLAACGGGAPNGEPTPPTAVASQSGVAMTAETAAPGAGATQTPAATLLAATGTDTLTAEQALASAPPLPTQAIPMRPSPVASELPLGTPASGSALSLPPTPACSGLSATPPDTEGPYFLDNTPERSSFIEPGMTGMRLIITGYVVTPDCQPVPGAQLEFWHAGPDGQYDLQGYRFRGHLFTDEKGYYRLETILPAVYEGRPRHIHVKVLPLNAPGLTTQLYFPDDSPLPALTIAYDETPDEAIAVFNFVVAAP